MALAITSKAETADLSADLVEAMQFLIPLSQDYPGIDIWFAHTVLPGLENGTRHIEVIRRDNRIVAMGIAKKTTQESKICTVRVCQKHENQGLGIRIFNRLLDWLETPYPVLSVSEKNLEKFERIFNFYGFKLTSSHNGKYVEGQVEYFFNESKTLRKWHIS